VLVKLNDASDAKQAESRRMKQMAKRNTLNEMHRSRTARNVVPRWIAGACTLALVAFAAAAHNQAPAPSAAPPDPPRMGGDMAHFVGFEGNVGGRIVTGSPYSAEATTEFTRTLSDGTVIDRKSTRMIARDGMGRTREERTLMAVGPFATSGTPPTIITINDPVAHKHYILNPKDKTARELGPGPRMGGMGGGRDGGHGDGRDGGGHGFAGRGPDGHAGGPGGGHDGDGPGGMRAGDQATTVSLGTQTIEGVTVEGTRTTSTIPAGAMGNEKPIMITFERWYSPDLLTDVKTVRSNPFEGTTTFMLTNLKRGEPDASLFAVPSDYKLITAMPGRGMNNAGPGGKGGWSGQQHMHGGPGSAPNPGGAPNSNTAPPPAAAPGPGQDN
jgi:hypothetical protein